MKGFLSFNKKLVFADRKRPKTEVSNMLLFSLLLPPNGVGVGKHVEILQGIKQCSSWSTAYHSPAPFPKIDG